MGNADLERRLAEAKQQLADAADRLRGLHHGGELADYADAHDRLLEAERAVAMLLGEEYATRSRGFPAWDTGAPLPHLLSGSNTTILVYLVNESHPFWDRTSLRVVDGDDESDAAVAIVRFTSATAVRVGCPNCKRSTPSTRNIVQAAGPE